MSTFPDGFAKTESKVSLALKCALSLEDCQSKQGVKLCSMGSSQQLAIAELLHCSIVETQVKMKYLCVLCTIMSSSDL